MKFISGIGSIGGAVVMSGVLYAVILASEYVYLKALTALLKKEEVVSGDKLKASVDDFMNNNHSEIKSFINEAKKNYKQENS